ncbi:MAG: GNAT family N-acetyltransferase [Balneolaceae bacterium]|nr:GNAT family N-acetyltransferase [Balneolaceae bacterium]MDR9447133.1 GNAT family N-acetyltransferase [Balneolaceae bacterium]
MKLTKSLENGYVRFMRIQMFCKPFEELSLLELMGIYRLRQYVFVVEQNSIYEDVDGYDPGCHHLMALDEDDIVGYTRLLPPGLKTEHASIGRVVTKSTHRGRGIGIDLMHESIACVEELYASQVIQLQAQSYLEEFYNKFGFERVGPDYMYENILHVDMIRTKHES